MITKSTASASTANTKAMNPPFPQPDFVEDEVPVRIPAYVLRRDCMLAPDMPVHYDAKPGDLVAMMNSYRASFEDRDDLDRTLDGFGIIGDTGLMFEYYDELTGRTRDRAARIAVDYLFLNRDVHGFVLGHEMVCDPVLHQLLVITFADARILIDQKVVEDPDEIVEDLEGNPDLAPCVIEIFGEADDEAMIAKAERYLEIFRLSIPEMGRPQSLDLDLRLGSER